MEWYLREDSDGLIVPSQKEAYEDEDMEDVLPTQYDWCQWRATESAENSYRKEVSMYGDEVCSGLGAREESSSHGQPVFKLENETEKMDNIFLDSILEEDQLCPDSLYTSLSFEDLMSNMLADNLTNACSIPMRDDDISKNWNKEDNSPSCLTSEEPERFLSYPMENKATVYVPRITSATDDNEAVDNLDEVKCSEASVLLELDGVMSQMNDKTRILFRDAMYRLAKSFEQKHSVHQIGSDIATQVNCDNSRMESSRSVESATNVIDRMVANLMFSERHCGLPELPIA